MIQTIIQYGCSCALPCCQTFLHTDYSTATAILKAITSYNNGTLFQVASKRRERFASSFLSPTLPSSSSSAVFRAFCFQVKYHFQKIYWGPNKMEEEAGEPIATEWTKTGLTRLNSFFFV